MVYPSLQHSGRMPGTVWPLGLAEGEMVIILVMLN